ncbi:MAG: tetratricopeptide repeat protein [Gammaproteobacteria bacterium]
MTTKDRLKNKAHELVRNKQLLPALRIYEELCKTDSGDAEVWFMLGGLHGRLNQYEQAVDCCRRSLAINPENAETLMNLGSALQTLGKNSEALECYQHVLRIKPNLAEAHYKIGSLLSKQSEFNAAEQSYEAAVRLKPDYAMAHHARGDMLKMQNRVDEAIDSYDKALQIAPGLTEAYWNKMRILPVIFDDQNQIDFYRQKYAEGLRTLDESLSLDTSQGRTAALKGIAASTNFFLQYQGRNDLELQCRFGEITQKIMSANFPQWATAVPMPALGKNGRIRIGYASGYLRTHNGALWLLGWLRHRNRDRFEIFCYHTGGEVDEKTSEFIRLSDHFHHFPGHLDKVCTQIRADQLHILVYPELGMEALSVLMAGLRLAPVQCVGWGHPITSGLPTMDYWLSSDLMEPENGQEHYSERLVRLPNMAHCYSKQQHDRVQNQPPPKQRSDFKLRDDAVLYLCCQSLFKYLPQYDHLLPQIAKRVPNAQFLFLAIYSVHVSRQFIVRIDRAFAKVGLRAQDYCVMLNRQNSEDYLNLNWIVDIFLDNPTWSGNNTTLVAIDCHLPVVTLPTEFMRGRHSYAVLKMLGLSDTIANDEQEYIDIAARLGTDENWRRKIVQKISDQHERIYEDRSCVQALEEFYREVVGQALQSAGPADE